MIIAIDGTAAAGKSTLARRIAAHYGLPHLDTGSIYRAVARDVVKAGHALTDVEAAAEAARNLDASTLSDPGAEAQGRRRGGLGGRGLPGSPRGAARLPESFAATPGGAVLEGRDIGTVVCPDARAKIFVSASAKARAARRYVELRGYGVDITEETVLREIEDRDRRDRERPVSPLIPAQRRALARYYGVRYRKSPGRSS